MMRCARTPGPARALTWRPVMTALSDVTTPIVSYHHGDFSLGDLQEMKGVCRISVCIPARDEETTIGPIVESAIGAAAHIHIGPAPTARSTTKKVSVDLIDRDALRNLGSSS